MYLARHRIKGKIKYIIRESFKSDDGIRSRDLFDLGTNPSQYIIYPGDDAYYIDNAVEERMHILGVQHDPEELEDIFWPFLDPEIKRVVEPFRQRYYRQKKSKKLDSAEKEELRAKVHLFDKRRIHFLRLGQMDQGYIGRMPVSLFKELTEKSRDEIEQYFIVQEQFLAPGQLKKYVYVIFDLQRFFSEMIAKKFPQGLDQKKVDRHFLEEICCLNQNQSFWAGHQTQDSLHEYLIRYVIMFFDNDYGYSTFLDDYIKDFMKRHRRYRPPEAKSTISVEEAGHLFGIKKEELKTMTKRGLTRLYRSKAQKFHPDKGGEHEEFIRLTDAYQNLLKIKRQKE